MSKRSQHIDVLFQHGERLHVAGRLTEAEQTYRQVLAVAPRHAATLHALGALALQSGHAAEAEALISRAIAQRPAAAFHLTRAHALLALKRTKEAVQCCRLVLRAAPNNAGALQALGHALSDDGQPEAALDAYQQAQRLQPALPDIANNIGTVLRQANRLIEAEQALLAAGHDPETLINLSGVQKELGAFDQAEATLRRVMALAPGNPIAEYNWSLLLLLLGRAQEAWPGWEQRFNAGAIARPPFGHPQWEGDPLGPRALLVHPEQGLGDIIQFCRYLPAIKGAVMFAAPPNLIRLLSSNPLMPMTPYPRYDMTAALLSLPARMGDLSTATPYLFAEAERIAKWRARVGAHGFRIGIAWQGNSHRHEDKGRSIPLPAFRPLDLPGVRLISLQKGEGEEQIAGAGFAVERLDGLDAGEDRFVDTAAVMTVLDLIVTSDTSIAHLAGALGCPVWVALRRVPDWRWMLDRADSPWYPSMRLFRQTRDGDWSGVFAAMAEALPQ